MLFFFSIIETSTSADLNCCDIIFPRISHVQQNDPQTTTNLSRLWNLPAVNLELIDSNQSSSQSLFKLKLRQEIMCKSLTSIRIHEALKSIVTPATPITNYRRFILKIKELNPNYPIYKLFNRIYEKSGYQKMNCTVNSKIVCRNKNTNKDGKKQRTSKKLKSTNENELKVIKKLDVSGLLWTEKYKATCFDDILGNTKAITSLRKWLECWLDSRIGSKKQTDNDSNSESEFDGCSSSMINGKLPGNTVVLTGPNGCGKSASIYAICNQLKFNILELNASSKRTGLYIIYYLVIFIFMWLGTLRI